MSKILVCGGTGFVGSAIVEKIKDHHQVQVLTRKQPVDKKRLPNVEYVVGNLFDIESLEKAMQGCDVVINAAQFDNAPFENPKKNLTYEKVDAQGTENIVAAAKKTNIARILYLSGAGVEDGKTEPWFVAKLRAEASVKNSAMKWTIFRPSWVYGKKDKSLNRMIPMVKYSPFVFILGKGYHIQPIYIEDVADVVAKAVDDPKTESEIYQLGGPQSLTMQQILQVVARVLCKRRIYLSIPKFWAAILFSILEKIPGVPVTRAALDFITMDVHISEEERKKAENHFQMRFRPLEKGLETYLR